MQTYAITGQEIEQHRADLVLFPFVSCEGSCGKSLALGPYSQRKQKHLAMLPLVSSPNDVWEMSAEIPYWWCVTTQIWVVVLTGRAAWEIWFNQSEALPRSGSWRVISMEFLRSFLSRHLAGKPVVASPNVSCFLRVWPLLTAPCN